MNTSQYRATRVGGCLAAPVGQLADGTQLIRSTEALWDYRSAGPIANRLWQAGTGSANRVSRLHLMHEPPLIDKSAITDKGSINQRAVLLHRAVLVEAPHGGHGIDVIVAQRTARA